MRALTIIRRNFLVMERHLQMLRTENDLTLSELAEELCLAVGVFWNLLENVSVHRPSNDQITLLARSTARMLRLNPKLDFLEFLLPQNAVVVCAVLKVFFWKTVVENTLIIMRACRRGADNELENHSLIFGAYNSVDRPPDRDVYIRQIILKNFHRKILGSVNAIDNTARMLVVRNLREQPERHCGEPVSQLCWLFEDLISCSSMIVHLADKSAHPGETGMPGLALVSFARPNILVQKVRPGAAFAANISSSAKAHLERNSKRLNAQKHIKHSWYQNKGLTHAK